MALGGRWGCGDGTPGAGGPHSPPPARRMLPRQLSFPSLTPPGLALGRHKAAWGQLMAQEWGQPMAWEGEAQTPPARAIPLWEARGDKHTSKHRNHQQKGALRKGQTSSPMGNTSAGFCICPNLALSLWKGLFVKCFVFMSPALISPHWLHGPLCSHRCPIPPSHVADILSGSGLTQQMSKGLKSA